MDTATFVALSGLVAWSRCRVDGMAIDVRGTDSWVTLDAVPVPPWEPGAGGTPGTPVVGPAVSGEVLLRWAPVSRRLLRYPVAGREVVAGEPVLLPPPGPAGDFAPVVDPGDPVRPVALHLDGDGLLAVADADGTLFQLDLPGGEVVGSLACAAIDLAGVDDGWVVLTADRIRPEWRIPRHGAAVRTVTSAPAQLGADATPVRIAAGPDGTRWILWRSAGAGVAVRTSDGMALPAVTGADDLEVDGTGAVLLARGPGLDLVRFDPADVAAGSVHPLRWSAPGYDGSGLVRTPEGRVGYWNGRGLRTAFGASRSRRLAGRLAGHVLDGGRHGHRWGRVFVDACVPAGSAIRIGARTADEIRPEDVDDSVPGPAGVPATPSARVFDDIELHPALRRDRPDLPWCNDRGVDVFEATVAAPPGRYLWLVVELTGDGTVAPAVRSIRVERPDRHPIDMLPAVYSDDPGAAGFLDRYLTLTTGGLRDLELAAADRHLLLDPRTSPTEMLPWLAGLIGLALDDRWPLSARRLLVSRAVPLFRRRGTVGALVEMIEILTGIEPVLMEQFRYRGLGEQDRVSDGFDAAAHRFNVVVPGVLDESTAAALTTLLDVHRPAHTLVQVCVAGSAAVGRGLQLGVTSVLGAGDRMGRLRVGGVLSSGLRLGVRTPGARIGLAELGRDRVLAARDAGVFR